MKPTLEKTIFFYDVYVDILPMYDAKSVPANSQAYTFASLMKKLAFISPRSFKTGNNDSCIIEFIETDDHYVFGSIGKLDDLKNATLKRERDVITTQKVNCNYLKTRRLKNIHIFI